MAVSLKKEDTVIVIAGDSRGKKGKVLRILKDEDRVLVEKVNLVKRHLKPNKSNPNGGIIEKESAIHVSNVMYFCDKCSKGVRLGAKILGDGKKVRVCKKCEEVLR